MVYRKALRSTGSGPAEEPVVDATAFPPGDGGGDDDAIGGGVLSSTVVVAVNVSRS